MIIAYSLILCLLSLYSYSLVDPNITLFSSPLWIGLREWAVRLGYYHRDWSFAIFALLVVSVFLFHRYFVHRVKLEPIKIALIIGLILLFSYPFLSHDFFNYLFDAKIVTFYHQNPYIMKALDFPLDPWIRFMHWTHRTYPYGPVFLLISLVPSALSLGKFIADYFLFKLLFLGAYLISVYLLSRMKKIYGLIFATHPLVIFEGLINNHNDMIAIVIAIYGLYQLKQNKNKLYGTITIFISSAVKYLSMPFVLLSFEDKRRNYAAVILFSAMMVYFLLFKELQPWYFLNLFILLPFFARTLESSWLFMFGLLMSYYPFIRFGEWLKIGDIPMKHFIIATFFLVNVCYLLARGTILKKKDI